MNAISFQSRLPPITFTYEDFEGINPSQDGYMVMTVDIDNVSIMKTLVDLS